MSFIIPQLTDNFQKNLFFQPFDASSLGNTTPAQCRQTLFSLLKLNDVEHLKTAIERGDISINAQLTDWYELYRFDMHQPANAACQYLETLLLNHDMEHIMVEKIPHMA